MAYYLIEFNKQPIDIRYKKAKWIAQMQLILSFVFLGDSEGACYENQGTNR